MKLSHVLIATLVTTSLSVSAQTSTKVKKEKSKAKTEKAAKNKNTEKQVSAVKSTAVVSVKPEPFICEACGRG